MAFEKFPLTRLTPKQLVFPDIVSQGHLDVPPLISSVLQVAIFIAHKDHESSLSSTWPVLGMTKLHSHFRALLKQLSSYAFEVRASLYRLKALGHKTALSFYRELVVERISLS